MEKNPKKKSANLYNLPHRSEHPRTNRYICNWTRRKEAEIKNALSEPQGRRGSGTTKEKKYTKWETRKEEE